MGYALGKRDFPVDGRYNIKTEADDKAEIFVDGVKIQTALFKRKTFAGDPKTYSDFNTTKGKKTVEIRLSNIRIPNTGFQQNPTVVDMKITTNSNVSTGRSKSWTINPVWNFCYTNSTTLSIKDCWKG